MEGDHARTVHPLATVRSARPAIRRTVELIHRQGPLSPAADAFLALAAK